jgi:8-oxo-dGTP pyrophosphatase MutT (NUDIX family)
MFKPSSHKVYIAIIILLIGIIAINPSRKIDNTTIINHLKSNERIADQELLELVIKSVTERRDSKNLLEAIIVRLANKDNITMYGKQVNDRLTESKEVGRRFYELHPYGKTGAGAAVVAVYKDQRNEIYVLLGRKYQDLRDKSKGLADKYILIGGYMHPHPLEGGEEEVETLDNETKDFAEELILKGEKGYNQVKSVPQELQLKSKSHYDYNLKACAIRELEEESGLKLESQASITPIATYSDYGMTNDKRLHTIVEGYLIDFGTLDQAPQVKPGSDIAELVWVRVEDIVKDSSKQPHSQESNDSRYTIKIGDDTYKIRDIDGVVIEDGLKKVA